MSSHGLKDRDAVLDGLRGAAVLAVVYVHYVFYTGITVRAGGGHVGVLVFFVLSGYLITRILWGDGGPDGVVTYRRFVRRRITRLYPALVGLVLVGAPLMLIAGPEHPRVAAEAALTALAQCTAFVFASGRLVLEPWLPTWSLTVEWTFYLIWPLVISQMRRRGLSAAAARRFCLVSAAGLYLVAMPLSPRAFYILPIANLGVMVVGAALALTHAQRKEGKYPGRDPQIADLAFLLFLVMVFLPSSISGHLLYRLSYFPAAVVAACFVLDQRPGSVGLTSILLQSRVMRILGLTSYSIYLWHLPVLWIVWWTLDELTAWQRAVCALAALVPVVSASFYLLERPWLRAAHPRGRGREPLAVAVMTE